MQLQYNNIQRKRRRGDEELKKNDRHGIVLYYSNNNKIIRVLHTSLYAIGMILKTGRGWVRQMRCDWNHGDNTIGVKTISV